MPKFRFLVMAMNGRLFMELHTNDIHRAVCLWDWLRCSDYKARVWDQQEDRFISEVSLEKSLSYV